MDGHVHSHGYSDPARTKRRSGNRRRGGPDQQGDGEDPRCGETEDRPHVQPAVAQIEVVAHECPDRHECDQHEREFVVRIHRHVAPVAPAPAGVEGKLLRVAKPHASPQAEWFDDVDNPEALIEMLREGKHCPDILTFWQRLPDTRPRFSYPMEFDSIAALPIKSYSYWWEKQIDRKARNKANFIFPLI